MRRKVLLLALLVCLGAAAQQKVTVKELVKFVRSSIDLKQPDRDVARYLKKLTLTERLDDRTIELLQGAGAGSKTIEALLELRDLTSNLPSAGKMELDRKPPVIPPPSPEEQKRVLDEVRGYALNYTKSLPNFICTQVTRRYGDPNGLEFWQKLDTVTAKLSYFEEKEDYKVILINDRPVDLSVDEVGGSTSTGEFGTLLREIFEPETETQFSWMRWGKLRGRLTHVYDYQVRQDRSKWSITWEKSASIVPAYTGLIYADRETNQVLRVTLRAQQIPVSFPIQEAGTIMDYDYVDIAGQQFMLPLKFEMRMRQSRLLVKNEVEFRLYRKFGTDTSISFETPAPLTEEMTKEEPPTK